EPREQAALGGGGDTVREVLFLGGGEAEVRSGQPGLVWRWQVGVDAGGHAAAGVRVVGGGAPVRQGTQLVLTAEVGLGGLINGQDAPLAQARPVRLAREAFEGVAGTVAEHALTFPSG